MKSDSSSGGSRIQQSKPAKIKGSTSNNYNNNNNNNNNDNEKRRATFGGSRLSLHSLRFFPSLGKEKESVSRSAVNLGSQPIIASIENNNNAAQLSVADRHSGSEAESELQQQQQQNNNNNIQQQQQQQNSARTPCKVKMKECPLCYNRLPSHQFPRLVFCPHRSCLSCMIKYLQTEILESRVIISCPECTELIHVNDIYGILCENVDLLAKFEEFSLRRSLLSDQDTRWCPAPDCGYAVIASGCAACPELKCERPGCGALFCYHCKMTWHPNQTCEAAHAARGSHSMSSHAHFDPNIRPGDIKACPRCRTYIVKMNDGSCNHMVCALCGSEFCWLCLKEISDLHYLSPSGCTFWGKKPWSRKKKLMWQLGTLIGAPVGIALIAGLAVPGIIFGFPIFVGKKVYQKMHDKSNKHRRRLAVVGSVLGSFLISPVLASMAVGVGVPVLLAYVYGVVPLSLCRSGGCGVSASSSRIKLNHNDQDLYASSNQVDHEKRSLLREDGQSLAVSNVTAMSLNSGSSNSAVPQHSRLHVQVDVCMNNRRRPSIESGAVSIGNYEEASVRAMHGSQHQDDKSVHTLSSLAEGGSYCEDAASTAALAGSVHDSKSICGTTSLIDNASVRALAGSIAPETLSGKYLISMELHNERHSPAPLLEEDVDICDGERTFKQTSEPPISMHKNRTASVTSAPCGSRFARVHDQMSTSSGEETIDPQGQSSTKLLNVSPRYPSGSVDIERGEYMIENHVTSSSKGRSVSLLDSAPQEIWNLIVDSPREPWTILRRVRNGGTTKWRTTATPYKTTSTSTQSCTSLPDSKQVPSPILKPTRSRTFNLPKFPTFSKKNRDK